jgi:hypothetical protein
MDNPFAILTAIVAPAILTNACSVLCLGTGNRIARVVDRTRVVNAEISALGKDSADYRVRVNQLERLQSRSQLLIRALRTFYAALGSFAAAALLSVIGSVLTYYNQAFAFHAAAMLGLLVGVAGVLNLIFGLSRALRETRLAVRDLAEEAELARNKFAG